MLEGDPSSTGGVSSLLTNCKEWGPSRDVIVPRSTSAVSVSLVDRPRSSPRLVVVVFFFVCQFRGGHHCGLGGRVLRVTVRQLERDIREMRRRRWKDAERREATGVQKNAARARSRDRSKRGRGHQSGHGRVWALPGPQVAHRRSRRRRQVQYSSTVLLCTEHGTARREDRRTWACHVITRQFAMSRTSRTPCICGCKQVSTPIPSCKIREPRTQHRANLKPRRIPIQAVQPLVEGEERTE